MAVYLIGTLDTKGEEIAFARELLTSLGVETLVVDAGCQGEPKTAADVPAREVFEAAGTELDQLRARGDRGEAVAKAAEGVTEIVRNHHGGGRVDGVLGLGGSAGTTIATAAMRSLPLGLPKVMVSTLASGPVRPYVGDKDIFMLNAVADVSGLNRISRTVLAQACRATAGLTRFRETTRSHEAGESDRPLIAASMFGVTTPCIEHARKILEHAGYEVIVFHATGAGGQAMESLIAEGMIAGVLDITTTELADELVGGILSAGQDRLTAAGARGIPQVISVGALDMVNFGERASVPARFAERHCYQHNPTVTLMRTTAEECARLGEILGHKAAAAKGATTILLPEKGVSALDAAGGPFEDTEARGALFEGIRRTHGDANVMAVDHHINDPDFAEQAAQTLLAHLRASTNHGARS